jgi:hypothetical protein
MSPSSSGSISVQKEALATIGEYSFNQLVAKASLKSLITISYSQLESVTAEYSKTDSVENKSTVDHSTVPACTFAFIVLTTIGVTGTRVLLA